MSNFSPKLQDTNNDQLRYLINESGPDFASLASDELTRRSSKELRETITVFNEQSSRQSEKMIDLTKALTGLTWILLLVTAGSIMLNINNSFLFIIALAILGLITFFELFVTFKK